ncbi:hypothetical protein KAJ83_01540 [Marivibrio halodurans]|uniref:Holin n=1 Tax=Marivibrio halodurans TaxID=2039722 RepID=A0A8J7V0U8_9PROT|nr:hypothetical protein [Marivibrio halodurans]MBP5855675.1 hypothetical protein [Marivibrio halodurans]
MGLTALAGTVVSGLVKAGLDWVKGKTDRARLKEKRKTKIEAAKNKRIQSKIKHNQDWDMEMAEGSKSSWKDEYWTIVLSVPVVLCFIPGMAGHVEEGFAALGRSVPEWYQVSLGAVIAAAVGVKKIVKYFKR